MTLAVAGLAYSWWASAHEPFTTHAAVAVGVPVALCAAVLAATWRRRHPRRVTAAAARPHRGTVRFFGGVAVLLMVWEARELAGSPRSAYPTVSSLVDHVVAIRPLHAVAFLVWLALGYLLLGPVRQR